MERILNSSNIDELYLNFLNVTRDIFTSKMTSEQKEEKRKESEQLLHETEEKLKKQKTMNTEKVEIICEYMNPILVV